MRVQVYVEDVVIRLKMPVLFNNCSCICKFEVASVRLDIINKKSKKEFD